MKVIALDPSGNFKEGKGTTGICIMEDGVPKRLDHVEAKDFKTTMDYWDFIITVLIIEKPDHIVMEGYRLYNHKGMSAKTQANSDLETPQLIGARTSGALMERATPLIAVNASGVPEKYRYSRDIVKIIMESGDRL
jgi:hypothetical protein